MKTSLDHFQTQLELWIEQKLNRSQGYRLLSKSINGAVLDHYGYKVFCTFEPELSYWMLKYNANALFVTSLLSETDENEILYSFYYRSCEKTKVCHIKVKTEPKFELVDCERFKRYFNVDRDIYDVFAMAICELPRYRLFAITGDLEE